MSSTAKNCENRTERDDVHELAIIEALNQDQPHELFWFAFQGKCEERSADIHKQEDEIAGENRAKITAEDRQDEDRITNWR